MEIFTRIIEEGFFVFWDDSKDRDYKIKVSITNANKKIAILDAAIEKGKKYFSLSNIGSGEYEVELNAFSNGKLMETVSKKINLVSSSQQHAELMEKLSSINSSVDSIYFDDSATRDILYLLKNPDDSYPLSDSWATFLERVSNARRRGY